MPHVPVPALQADTSTGQASSIREWLTDVRLGEALDVTDGDHRATGPEDKTPECTQKASL